MKMKDKKTLFEKTAAELRAMVVELRKKIAEHRVEMRFGKLKDVRTISKLRDDLARAHTVLRMKEFEENV